MQQPFQLEDVESVAKYSRFFSLSLDLLCIAGFDGYFKHLNQTWSKVLGWSNQELIAKPFIEFVHPEDRESTILEAEKLTTGLDTIYFENRYLCADGSYKWLSWNSTTFHEEKLIYAIARDITITKEQEIVLRNSLQESENLKYAINAHSLVAITDYKGRITYVNDKFCTTSQYSREELIGKNHKIINSGYHSKEFFAQLWETISQGKIWQGEIKNKAKDGTFYWVETTIVPKLSADGRPEKYVAIRTDITQRKFSELAIRERSHLSLLSAEVSLILAQSGSLTDIIQQCTHTISQYLNVAFVGIWTGERQTTDIQFQAGVTCTDSSCSVLTNLQNFPNQTLLVNSVIDTINQNHQVILNQDLPTNYQFSNLENISSNLLFSAYPLIVEEELVGIMALFSCESLSQPTHNMLNWIANNIAVAIDRIWAKAQLLSRREALLLGLASQIRSSLELDTILETAVREIRSLLQIDRCYFIRYLPDFSQTSLSITHEARQPELPSILSVISLKKYSFLAKHLLHQELICIHNIDSDRQIEEHIEKFLTEFGITSLLLLPVSSNTGELGAIVCSHCSGERVWEDSEINLLQAVTDQLGIAIDHAQLYTQSRSATLAAQAQAEKLSDTLHKLQQTQAQLIQQEKMSSLGQLVAGIAHEINNPVNFIHGNLTPADEYVQELLELLKLYEKHYPYPVHEIQEFCETVDLEFIAHDLLKLLSSMRIGTNRIREIVLSLRNFSRLDEAEMKAVNIHEGLDSTLLILQNRLKAKPEHPIGIEIIKEYGGLPLVECYPGQINQVFMNIINNSIDALENDHNQHSRSDTQNNRSQIRIRTELVNNNRVIVRIADNGTGIAKDVQSKLFDPFFTTKPVGKGTGLGLSISYQIVVEKHAGILRCESILGKGTEFWIEIPLKQKETPILSQELRQIASC
ncbi:two-component sensor histidine kinase [Tolypothrix tenuis PCC 7101]|uniref:histidine kinase n=1 Tax=Tolypothrix tenuis PCC 7101 TaxID=231146 RepID=A0A1Z4N6G7_9CYAN|nr:PAS domain S-box protein [Aulosira sp. FACHB-113]BAZ01320.1 two-component sensor histidine kinase [Tolypothrix tenuis PCC 7101]BAZ74757.1 two-component sensor histidine kinase [Aulosira laxa NIES-50]